jgi:methionyl-tRNA formyltransferase
MIYICAYRDWGIKIHEHLTQAVKCNLITSTLEFDNCVDTFKNNDKIFFIGWSWIVPNEIIEKYECICLHPSPLPKYRGGSPIQHQILNGETKSAVSYFRMINKLDGGNILYQEEFSLEGNLKDITNRIIPLGIKGIFHILKDNVQEKIQDEEKATYFKRRTPAESELDITNLSAQQLYNKIRALQDPYPNAYITCKDGKRLFIKLAEYEK